MDEEKLRGLEDLLIHRELEFLNASGDVDRALRKRHHISTRKFNRLIARMKERGDKLAEVKLAIKKEKEKTNEKS